MNNATRDHRHGPRCRIEERLPIPAGVVVVTTKDLPSGKAWWSPEHRVILVDAELVGPDRHRAIAHECAHIILGHHGGLDSRITEPAADAFGEVLLCLAETSVAVEDLRDHCAALEGGRV